MKKLLIYCLLLTLAIKCYANETVRIDFFPDTPEEFDIFFQKGFESIGYTTFINYFDRSVGKSYDLLFKYEWNDNTLKVALYANSGKLLKSSEKKFVYFDRIETTTYLFLGEFLDRMINVKDRRGRLEGAAGRISAKLDSAIYVIQAEGKDSTDVLEKFLEAGNQLAGKFSAYYEITKYQGESFHALIYTAYFGTRIRGIIIGDNFKDRNYLKLDTLPEIYDAYLAKLTGDLELPTDNFGGMDNSRLYLMRSTGHIASEWPFTVFIDGMKVCYLNDKKYAVFKMDQGKHTVIVQMKGESIDQEAAIYKFIIMPSKNIYFNVLMDSTRGLMCQEENEYEAKIIISDLKWDDCNSLK
jgi:hypothetical protein